MDTRLLDGYFVPALVPTIMSINLYKQFSVDKIDLLYTTVVFGTLISTISSLLQFHISRFTRSRTKLTICTATILTTASLLSILGFNFIRMNLIKPNQYQLPLAVRGQVAKDGSDVFRYHFFADFLPGLIIFVQSQLCSMIVSGLLNKAKRKFTIGEASLTAQLFSSAYLVWLLTIYSRYYDAGPFQINLTTDIILNIGFILFSVVFIPSFLVLKGNATLARYGLIGLSIALSYVRVRSLIAASSQLEPLTWLVDYIFTTHQRISLFSLWLSTLTACVSFSTSWTRMVGQTNSLVRKIFHLAICVVFISGYNQDLDFTRFAGGGIVVVLFLIEMIRAWQLKPIGSHLESVCQALRGKWDNRYLTLSHIYLLVGTFLPLWLLPNNTELTNKLILSSGLLAVGVGDTAAAIVGTFLGKTRIREQSGKTVEGLIGNILAMVLFKLIWVGYSDFVQEFSFVIAAVLTSFMEAFTENCDNLILPLVMILFIQIF